VLCGFFYILKKGVLNWSSDEAREAAAAAAAEAKRAA